MTTCLTRQEEILRDCEQMIPDTTRRLKDATTELHTYMVRNFVLLRRPVLAKQLGRQTSGTKLIRPWLPCRRKAKKSGAMMAVLMAPPPPIEVKFLGTCTSPIMTRNYSRCV